MYFQNNLVIEKLKKIKFYVLTSSLIGLIGIVALIFMSYYGYLGGRFIFPRNFSPERAHRILQKQKAIRIAQSIINQIRQGEHLDKLEKLKYSLGYEDISKLKQEILQAKTSDRLNWAILLSGAYDKSEGTYIVWLTCGVYMEINVRHNISLFEFKVKG